MLLAMSGHASDSMAPVLIVGAAVPANVKLPEHEQVLVTGATAPGTIKLSADEQVLMVGAEVPDNDGTLNGPSFWGIISTVSGIAPPPSLVKCVGATLAGSAFALLGMLVEGRRGRRDGTSAPKATHEPQRAAAAAKEPSAPTTSQYLPQSRRAATRATQAAMKASSDATASTSASETARESGSRCSGSGSSKGSRAPRLRVGSKTALRQAPPFRAIRGQLSEVDRLEREVKSILNKLTRERFDTLYAKLLSCCVGVTARAEVIAVVAREVFAKATTQHNYIELYADVCAKLHADLVGGGTAEVDFKRSLLDQCQRSFHLHLQPPRIDQCLDYEEQYEVLVKYKTKMLGNVRLIGNLLRLRMLSPKIIFICTDELLSISSNEALETLCAFLDTLGAAFDNLEWPGRPRLEEVYARAQNLAKDPQRSARIRCLLKDLLDKRRKGWQQWPTRASESGRTARSRAEGSDIDPAGSSRPALSNSLTRPRRGSISDSSQGATSESACAHEASRIQQRQ